MKRHVLILKMQFPWRSPPTAQKEGIALQREGGELTVSVISAMSSLCSQLGNMFVNVRGSRPAWIR